MEAPPKQRGFDAVCAAFQAHGHVLRLTRRGFVTTCPVHQDRRPSLNISRARDAESALIYCHACGQNATKTILAAVGLSLAHLYASDRVMERRGVREVIAEYPYVTMQGELVATKVRYRDALREKRFAWRVNGLWELSPAAKASLPLYREAELIACPQVFVVEGEKAVNRLWAERLPATCAPYGAGRWDNRWTAVLEALGTREVVVLTDADVPGRAHGEQVAASLHRAGLVVRVVELAGLPQGGDVVDYLAAHTADALQAEVAAAPTWWPGQAESERVQKKRATWRRQKAAQRARKRSVDPDVSGALSTLRTSVASTPRSPGAAMSTVRISAMSTLSTCPPHAIPSSQSCRNLTCTDMEEVRRVDIPQGRVPGVGGDLGRRDLSPLPEAALSDHRDLAQRGVPPNRNDPDWEIYCPLCGLEACERIDHLPTYGVA